jgi:hypothetical protein
LEENHLGAGVDLFSVLLKAQDGVGLLANASANP